MNPTHAMAGNERTNKHWSMVGGQQRCWDLVLPCSHLKVTCTCVHVVYLLGNNNQHWMRQMHLRFSQ